MPVTIPAVNSSIWERWTPLDREAYFRLPYFVREVSASYHDGYRPAWDPILGRVKWTPNSGDEMLMLDLIRSPESRQVAQPARLKDEAKVDVNKMSESTNRAFLRHHEFMTPTFRFEHDFVQFISGKVRRHLIDLEERMRWYREAFYRFNIWAMSPYVYVCGHGLIEAPVGELDEAMTSSNGKNLDWFVEEVAPKCTETLGFKHIYEILAIACDDLYMTPFAKGMGTARDSELLDDRFLVMGAEEIWRNLINDPWFKENRTIDWNVVTKAYRGDFFGRVRFRSESRPLRFLVKEQGQSRIAELPPLEHIKINGPLAGRPLPSPDYAQKAQYSVAWWIGGEHYQAIQVGPPPADFAKAPDDMKRGLEWNGRPFLSGNILIEKKDSQGNTVYLPNIHNEWVQGHAKLVMGIGGFNPQNILPIVYLRPARTLNIVS